MTRSITLYLDGSRNPSISFETYKYLHENYIFFIRDKSESYLQSKKLTFIQLREVARLNNINYVLFFASKEVLLSLVERQNEALFDSLDNKEIITGSREDTMDIRAIRWIVADLASRIRLYKQYGNKERLTRTVKYLSNSTKSIQEQASYIIDNIAIDMQYFHSLNSKKDAYKYLCRQISSHHVHVTTEAKNCMPQNIPPDLELSGLFIRDNFNPIIFICNEISGHPDEGPGRKIYTLVFLLASLFKGRSFAISINKENYSIKSTKDNSLNLIHEITNEILMPASYFSGKSFLTKEDLINEASVLKISPTALLVRLNKLGIIQKNYRKIKDELRDDFDRYIQIKKIEAAEKRKSGNSSGPTPKTLYKSYQGDFIDFVKTKVPENLRKTIFENKIVYGRTFISFEDL